ncbi:MAG: SDR family NAD(P)-dependent oxidoreductase [Acidobacteriota bacterium]|nr:SDR family NAD(P)-dependent oxidoreductase [Acidobacteriota bacterium]
MGERLRGRRILVTGAARGLGASAAWGLAEEGAECILLDRSGDELRATVDAAARRGPGPFHPLVCDLASREATLDAAARAREAARGDLTLLVHCAAVFHVRPIEETTDAQWDDMLAVNLAAAFLLVRELMPELRAGGGSSVLLTSSRAAIMGFARETGYCATKFGTEGLAKAIAEECAADGILANTITPGARRIKPTGLSRAEEAAIPEAERTWGSSEALGAAFAAFALLRGFEGGPNGRRFEADRVADTVRARGLPLPAEAWAELAT